MTTRMRSTLFLATMLLVSTACGNDPAPAAPSKSGVVTTVARTAPTTVPDPTTTNASAVSTSPPVTTTRAVATPSPPAGTKPTAEQIAEIERTLDEIDALLGQAESDLDND